MKIRADFVTNSSSSNFITIEIYMMQGKSLFMNKDDYEGNNLSSYDSHSKLLDSFTSMRSIEELLAFLELDSSDFTDDITQYDFQDICWISVGYNKMLYGEEKSPEDETLIALIKDNITNFLMDLDENDMQYLYPDGVDWDKEISEYFDEVLILVEHITYSLRDRTISRNLSLDTL